MTIRQDVGFASACWAVVSLVSAPLLHAAQAQHHEIVPPTVVQLTSANPYLDMLWQTVFGLPYIAEAGGIGLVESPTPGIWDAWAIEAVDEPTVQAVGTFVEFDSSPLIEQQPFSDQGIDMILSSREVNGVLSGPAGSLEMSAIVMSVETNDPEGQAALLHMLMPMDEIAAYPAGGSSPKAGNSFQGNASCVGLAVGESCEDLWNSCRACCQEDYRVAHLNCTLDLAACLAAALILRCSLFAFAWWICALAWLAICGTLAIACMLPAKHARAKCLQSCNNARSNCDPTWIPPGRPMQ